MAILKESLCLLTSQPPCQVPFPSPQVTPCLLKVPVPCPVPVLSWLSTSVLADNRFLLVVSPVRFHTCHEMCLKLTLHTLFTFYCKGKTLSWDELGFVIESTIKRRQPVSTSCPKRRTRGIIRSFMKGKWQIPLFWLKTLVHEIICPPSSSDAVIWPWLPLLLRWERNGSEWCMCVCV